MPGGVFGGVLELALVTLGVTGCLWCVFNQARLGVLLVRVGRLVRVLPPAAPTPIGLPIERIAADLRRIRPEAVRPLTGMPMARRRGIIAAYDQALVEACRALGVDTELDRIRDDLERESERLRTESELERAGVDLG